MIKVAALTKVFKTFDRREGLAGAVRDLFSRRYREMRAVDGISFHIPKGEIAGYIGANGAGKSTTIKMLTGILHPTSGSIAVAGLDPFRERQRYLPNIGVVFGQRTQLWWDLAVQESFSLLQRIYRIPEQDFRRRLQRFDEVLGIGAFLRTPVRKLSLGQKMRCELTAALLHAPRVLYLDEPTIGLDIEAKVAIREFLKTINREQEVTVILTTHDLKDIEELCRRVIIIDRGQLVYDGALLELRRRLGGELELKFHLKDAPRPEELEALRRTFPAARFANAESHTLTASFPQEALAKGEVIRAMLERFEVRDLSFEEPSIEEVVRQVYRGGLVAAGS